MRTRRHYTILHGLQTGLMTGHDTTCLVTLVKRNHSSFQDHEKLCHTGLNKNALNLTWCDHGMHNSKGDPSRKEGCRGLGSFLTTEWNSKKTCYFGKTYFPLGAKTFYREILHIYVAIFGKYSQHNALRFFVKSLTAAAGSRRHADVLYGVNDAAERPPGAANVPQRSAVLPTRPKSAGKSWDGCCLWFCFRPRTKRYPCPIHPWLTASVASPIFAVINATGYPSYLPIFISQVRASLAWGIVGWFGSYNLA